MRLRVYSHQHLPLRLRIANVFIHSAFLNHTIHIAKHVAAIQKFSAKKAAALIPQCTVRTCAKPRSRSQTFTSTLRSRMIHPSIHPPPELMYSSIFAATCNNLTIYQQPSVCHTKAGREGRVVGGWEGGWEGATPDEAEVVGVRQNNVR